MSVQEFFRKMKDIRLSLSRNGDKLILKKDGRVVSAKDREIIENNRDLISYIREHRSELLEYVPLANKDWSDRKAEGIQSMYRLSGVQEGMLFHSLYEVGGDIYIEQYTCELRNITAEVFVRSWQLLTRKHSIFRTAFYYDRFKIPVQCVHKQVEMPVHISDIRHLDPSEQQAHMNAYMRQDLERGFDPQTPPLMRVALFRLDEERYCMLWTFHHILLDGWSMQVLKQEFRNLCSLLLKGHIILDEEDRFEDYIRWIERQDKEKEKSYWTRYLKDVDHPSLLPFIEDRLEKTKGVGRYKYIELELDRSLTRALNGYVRGCRVTMNTLMLGVWAYLLYRYTSHEHILFGVTVAGRPEDLPDVERRLGLYINTIPFYTRVEESLLIMEWLAGIQQDQLLSRQYQYTSLGDIRKWKKLQGDLFDCLVVFENYPVGEKADEDTSTPHLSNEQMQEHTNYPLCLSIAGSDRLYVSFEYNADVLNEQYVQQASDHFKYVLEQIVVDGRERICDLRLLSEKHLHGVMEMSKGEDIVYDREKTLVDLFVEQVLRTPEAVALVSGEAEVSYRELEDRSNRLGHYLLQLGVGLEEPVGICLEREWGLVVGMLGILKAGGAYVPLDPDYPLERLEYMLSDTGAKVVISSRGVSSRLPGGEYRVIWMDEWEESMGREPVTLPEVVLRPDNLAYIMYTSGSTGRPKGVMVEHGNFINTSMAWRRQYDFSNHCPVVFSVAGMAFDVFSGDVFRALLNGGKVVLADGEGRLDPSYLYGEMKKHGVHYLESTPALMKNLVEHVAALRQDLSFLRIMVVGSDVCSPTDFNYLKNSCPGVRLLNSFGVTEAAVDATFFEGRPHDRAALSIGRPMDNIRCYILDEQMRLLPKGCIGEICIGGRSVARGYWGLEELTRERFVPDPYSERSGVRMYRTGDRGRWLADGNIEYLGRSDEQVKISGYRIEPGEIGNVLLESGLVRQAVVVARG
ncbi:MAG: amino acid adenylation domain-containing protein, partial [Chitinophagaceae bacterium]|nr:amino acid adenylation domain-containing protein [Chitinophagaceae bacterium]